MDQYRPITQRTVTEQVAQRLMDMIRSGALKPGARLPAERELAVLLGVGRPAVREAVRGLSLLGLLDIKQGDGTFVGRLEPRQLLEPLELVIDLTPGSLAALFDARSVIEPGVAALSALRLTDEQLAQLDAFVADEVDLLSDPQTFAEHDLAFHQLIIDACGNPYLQRVADSFHLLSRKSRRMTAQTPHLVEKSLDDHRAILRALRARDADAARDAMQRHLMNVRGAYLTAHAAGTENP